MDVNGSGDGHATKLLMVGDLHGDLGWWESVVVPVAAALEVDAVVLLGDVGYWFDESSQLLVRRLAESERPVYFIDGNHEDHDGLDYDVELAREAASIVDATEVVPLRGNLRFLPRGGRWQVGGVHIAAMGGAVSVDRAARQVGVSWFPQERVNDIELDRLAARGHAEVLLCHDAPAGWDIPGLGSPADTPRFWWPELRSAAEHRCRLGEAMVAVQPRIVIHGHYHQRYSRNVNQPWGEVRVEGLADSGNPACFCVLTCDTTASVSDVLLNVTST